MSRRGSSLSAVQWVSFLLYVLEPRRASGGWIQAGDVVRDLGLSRATAYRYILKAEEAGLPIQRDGKVVDGLLGAGFRCMLQTTRRPDDTVPIAERRRLRKRRGPKRTSTTTKDPAR